MKIKFILSIALLFSSQFADASDINCTMAPVPIDVKRIAHQSSVKNYFLSQDKLKLTALLKNGNAVKLAHMGCYDSGGIVTEWLDSEIPTTETDKWIKKAVVLANAFLDPYVFGLIKKSIHDNKYSENKTDNHLVITGSASEIFSYSITVTPFEHGVMLTVDYNFSG